MSTIPEMQEEIKVIGETLNQTRAQLATAEENLSELRHQLGINRAPQAVSSGR